MSTTSILFDSPALSSLKRAQLVQLCKRHNIRASGKNVDLVDRLKQHADSLSRGEEPQMSPFKSDQVVYDEDEDEDACKTRPSDKWEVVMEGIEEDPFLERKENLVVAGSGSSASLKSFHSAKDIELVNEQGELGPAASKSNITSSLKSIASSLSFKRTFSNSSNPFAPTHALQRSANVGTHAEASVEPTIKVTPLSPASPSGFDVDASMDRPVPGLGACDAADAAYDVEGTIRLITPPRKNTIHLDDDSRTPSRPGYLDSFPRLAPYKPAFEIVPPTPGWSGVKVWPISPVKDKGDEDDDDGRVYPSLAGEFEAAGLTRLDEDDDEEEAGMSIDQPAPRFLQPATATESSNNLLSPPSQAFVFGSPNPRHSTSANDFANIASSVLAEMNARLGASSTSSVLPGIDATLLQATGTSTVSKMSEEQLLNYQFGGAKGLDGTLGDNNERKQEGSIGWKFDKAHEKVFSKMEGIDSYYAKRAGISGAGADERLAPLPVNRKRKSHVLGTGMGAMAGGTKKKGGVLGLGASGKKKTLPGAFGEEEDEDDEGEEVEGPNAKRVRVSSSTTAATSTAMGPADADDHTSPKTLKEMQSEAARLKKERESIKRVLEMKKARRRSSRAPGGLKTPMKKTGVSAGRFGMGMNVLASAKSLVKSVWNRGAGTGSGASGAPSTTAARERKASTLVKPPSATASKSGTLTSTNLSVPKTSTGKAAGTTTAGCTSSRASGIARMRSRSPNGIGMGPPPAPSAGVGVGSMASGPSRTASRKSTRTISVGSRNSASSGAPSTMRASSTSTVASTRSRALSTTSTSTSIGSRLFAPTASSLAKMKEKNAAAAVSAAAAAVRGPSPTKIPKSMGFGFGFGMKGAKSTKPASNGSTKVNAVGAKLKSKSIFSTPLPLRMQGISDKKAVVVNKENSAANMDVVASMDGETKMNPITGILSPSKNSSTNAKTPSLSRKPRISRGKVIAKLEAQRSDAPATEGQSNAIESNSAVPSTPIRATPKLALSAKKQKLRARSSVGAARRGAKAVLGVSAANAGAGGVLMSAKRRARRSEVDRRRTSVKNCFEGGQDAVGEEVESGEADYNGSAMDLEVEV